MKRETSMNSSYELPTPCSYEAWAGWFISALNLWFWIISAWWHSLFTSWSPSLDGLCQGRSQGRAAEKWSKCFCWKSAQLKLFWLFDGITVPLQIENWDNSGIWSGLFAFPQQGKRKGRNVLPVKWGRKKRQSELWCLLGIQVAAHQITSNSLTADCYYSWKVALF